MGAPFSHSTADGLTPAHDEASLEPMTPKLSPAQAFPGFTQTPSAHWTRPVQVPRSHPTHPRLPSSPPNLPSAHVHALTGGSAGQKARTLRALFRPMSNQPQHQHPSPATSKGHPHFPSPCPSIYFPRAAQGAFPKAAPARSLLPTSSPPCSPARRSRSAQSPHAFRMRSQLLHLVKKGSALPLPNLHAHTQCASDG